jgi:hypothetical protein
VYLAKFNLDGAEVCQALVLNRDMSSRDLCDAGSQLKTLTQIADNFAVRTRQRKGQLERVWILNTNASRESDFVRELERLHEAGQVHYEVAVDKEWHDRVATDFPTKHLMWIRSGEYRAGEYALASGFRLGSVLDAYFECAVRFGWDVLYQFNAARYENCQNDQRELRKQLTRMELDDGFPRKLLNYQKSIFDRAAEPGYLVDEFVGAAESQASDYLRQIVEDEFAVRLHQFNFGDSPLEPLPDEMQDDALTTGFQFEILGETDPVVRAASAVSPAELDEMNVWKPRIEAAHLLTSDSGRIDNDEAADVFISYSSRDAEAAARVCEFLELSGVRCWIAPRNIRAGAPYPAEIARALKRCKTIVLVFSEHSNVSPHVQREVERVVSRSIPIITLKLQDIPMTDAMEYLISTHHCLMVSNPPTDDELQWLSHDVLAHLLSSSSA